MAIFKNEEKFKKIMKNSAGEVINRTKKDVNDFNLKYDTIRRAPRAKRKKNEALRGILKNRKPLKAGVMAGGKMSDLMKKAKEARKKKEEKARRIEELGFGAKPYSKE